METEGTFRAGAWKYGGHCSGSRRPLREEDISTTRDLSCGAWPLLASNLLDDRRRQTELEAGLVFSKFTME